MARRTVRALLPDDPRVDRKARDRRTAASVAGLRQLCRDQVPHREAVRRRRGGKYYGLLPAAVPMCSGSRPDERGGWNAPPWQAERADDAVPDAAGEDLPEV
uniref:(northern house mosquito) hypothetical protein n=1 Tax=Culex pipiens TaxID=7175 RepID=A0A8D8BDE1_CULPI